MNNFKGRLRGAHVALVLFLLLFFFSPAKLRAQQGGAMPSTQNEGGQDAPAQVRDADLPRLLNLSPEQVEKIKTILAQDRDEWRTARQRLNQSQRALDKAIYQDNAEQSVIEARSHDVTEAQATVGRMRAIREFNIRRVLTPEQIDRLRVIRLTALKAQRQQNRLERQQRRMGEDGGGARRPNLENLGRRQNPDAQGNNNSPVTTTPRAQNQKVNRQLMTPRERRAERLQRKQL